MELKESHSGPRNRFEYIQVGIAFNYILSSWTSRYMSLEKSRKYTFLAAMCILGDLNKDVSLDVINGKGIKIVKSDIYLDMLLVGSIYVTKYVFSRNPPNPRHPANPVEVRKRNKK